MLGSGPALGGHAKDEVYYCCTRCGRKGVLAAGTIERCRKESEAEYEWEEREDNI